jgi:putative OPT family oligopeptide transporter
VTRAARAPARLFGGLFLGGLWALAGRVWLFFAEYPGWSLDKISWKGKSLSLFKGGSIGFETNPVLLGTGYIIGWRTSFIMLAGGVLSFLVLIPAIVYFGPDMVSAHVAGGTIRAADMNPGQVRNAFVLYIGAGAVAAGGLISLARALPTIFGAFARGLAGLRGSGGRMPLRTERDLPMSVVLIGCIALVLAIWAPNALKGPIGRDILGIDWISAILIVVFGFFFVTVSSRICGEIGSSSNPISGMTVATLLITCGLFVAVGRTGIAYKEMALCTAALVCVAASNGGATSQALKTGYLVGATPRKQQIAISWGVITSAAVIGFTLWFMNDSYTTYHKREFPGFAATQAHVDELAAQGRGAEVAIGREKLHWRNQDWDHVYVREDQLDPSAPGNAKKILVPRGHYLAKEGVIAYYVDPGVCGTETTQLKEDGTVERRSTRSSMRRKPVSSSSSSTACSAATCRGSSC